MSEKDHTTIEAGMPKKGVRLKDWNKVVYVFVDPAIVDAGASREPSCLEWVIAKTLANAVAVTNAPFCSCGNDDPELQGVNLEKVIALVADETVGGMLDDTIHILRQVLKERIKRGDGSVFAVETEGIDAEA